MLSILLEGDVQLITFVGSIDCCFFLHNCFFFQCKFRFDQEPPNLCSVDGISISDGNEILA